MANKPDFQNIERDGSLEVAVHDRLLVEEYLKDFPREFKPSVTIEDRVSYEKHPDIKDRDVYIQKDGFEVVGYGSAIVTINDHTTGRGPESINIDFEIPEEAITMKYHPKVVNEHSQVVFNEEVSLADIDASMIKIEPTRDVITSKDLLTHKDTTALISNYEKEIQGILQDFTMNRAKGPENFKDPSHFKGPSADTITYKMLAENPRALAEREMMALERAKGSDKRLNKSIGSEPRVEFYMSPSVGEQIKEKIDVLNIERLKERGSEFNNDADFEAKAELYGHTENAKHTFAKNKIQEQLQQSIRQVEPPFSDAEKRLMVVTDNWNEPTLEKTIDSISTKEIVEAIKQQKLYGDKENPYELLNEKAVNTANILLDATKLDNPKHVEAVQDSMRDYYEKVVAYKVDYDAKNSLSSWHSLKMTDHETRNLLDNYKAQYFAEEKLAKQSSNDLDSLDVDSANMDIDKALSAIEESMANEAIDISNTASMDNTQTAENELDNTMSSPSPRP